MPEFLISAIICNRASVASEKIFEKMREEEHTMQTLGPKVGGHLYSRFLLTEMYLRNAPIIIITLRLCKFLDSTKAATTWAHRVCHCYKR